MGRYFRSKHLLSEFALNPEFVEWRGCRTIEMLTNRRYITDLFINPPTAAPDDLLFEAGVMVRDAWLVILKARFPDRFFEIHFEFALPIAEITFYQVTDESALRGQSPYIVHTI